MHPHERTFGGVFGKLTMYNRNKDKSDRNIKLNIK